MSFNIVEEQKSPELSILDEQEIGSGFFNSQQINEMAVSMSAAVFETVDPRFIRAQVETLGSNTFDKAAADRGAQIVIDEFNAEIQQAIEQGSIEELVKADQRRQIASDFVAETMSPEVYTAARQKPGNPYDHAAARMAARLATTNKILAKHMEADTPGIIGGIGDFLDLMITAPFDALRLGGFNRNDMAKRIADLQVADIPEDQFEAEVEALITEMKDAGILTDSNFFYLASAVENVNQRGRGSEAQLERLFNVIDLAGVTTAAGRTGLRALRGARDTTALVSALSGSEKGAQNLSRAMADVGSIEANAAGVARHGSPAVARHPENFNEHKSWFAPGVELAARLRDEDSYFNLVRQHNFGPRITAEQFERWKPTGMERLVNKIEAEKQSRILDLDIDMDDTGNLFGVVSFGRKDGTPFQHRRSAEKLAKELGGVIANTKTRVTPRITEFDPNTVGARFSELAKDQRGTPEIVMTRVQSTMGGGVLNPVVERAGDTLHRAFQFANRDEFLRDDTLEKVQVVVRRLNDKFGFEKELSQNIRNNAEARGQTVEEFTSRLDNVLGEYTQAYKELTPFNDFQKLIIDGNIAIGEKRWDDARRIWDKIHDITKDPDKFNKAVREVGDLADEALEPVEVGGFRVNVFKNVSPEGIVDDLTNEQIGQVYYGMLDDLKLLGGTFLSLPSSLDALAKRGEGVFSKVARDINKRLTKTLKAIPSDQKKHFENVMYQLRDGEHAHLRKAYNEGEFISEFYRISNGQMPSRATIDAYFELQEVSDSFYMLKADKVFKRAVEKGYDEVVTFDIARADGSSDEFRLITKRTTVDQLADDDVIVNPITNQEFSAATLPDNHKLFRVATPHEIGENEYRFVAFEQPTTRRLFHTDVLGYNPGGPRQYEFLKFAVKQDRRGGRPITIMGAETSEQATKGMNEINEILRAARESVPNIASLTRAQAIRAIEDLANIDDIVLASNGFDNSIESAQDFAAFLRSQKIDPRENVGMARMDRPVLTENAAGDLEFLGGDTYGEVFEFMLNQPSNGPRADAPLRGYNNAVLETKSPIETIQNDYMRVLHDKAFSAFHFNAVNGWLQGAKRLLRNRSEIEGMDPVRAMNEAVFADDQTKEARNFLAARAAINRVLGTKTGYEQKWDSLIDRTVDWVFQKGYKGTAKTVDKYSRNPATALRGWSFDARLGLLAVDQLLVQSSQAFNIWAIVGPKRTGEFLQAAATHIPLRIALENGTPEVVRAAARRVAPWTGMDPDEFVEFAEFVKNSGRMQIGGEVAEISNLSSTAARGFLGKARQAARVFFNEGEKFPRAVGLRVAWNEYKRAFPNSPMNSDHAIQWMTARQDALTAAMTRSSRSVMQMGPQSIPFQFLTYISRMMESLFTDRLLTRRERGRLMIAQTLFWGTSGLGISSFTTDTLLDEGKVFGVQIADGGVPMDEFNYTALRYGLLNAMANEAMGTQNVAFGERLAPAAGIADLLRRFADNNFTEIIGGPVAQLGSDVWSRMPQMLSSIASGNSTIAKEDAIKMLRNITSFNRGYQAWYIARLGDYYGKNNDRVVSGLSGADAALVFLGSQVQEANLAYDRGRNLSSEREQIKIHTNRIREMVNGMQLALKDGRPEDAMAIGDQIGKEMSMLEPHEFNKVYNAVTPEFGTVAEQMLMRVLEESRGRAAQVQRED